MTCFCFSRQGHASVHEEGCPNAEGESFQRARDEAVRIASSVLPEWAANDLVNAILRASLIAQKEVLNSDARAQHTGKNEPPREGE